MKVQPVLVLEEHDLSALWTMIGGMENARAAGDAAKLTAIVEDIKAMIGQKAQRAFDLGRQYQREHDCG